MFTAFFLEQIQESTFQHIFHHIQGGIFGTLVGLVYWVRTFHRDPQ